ncbi:hypothetical protein UFOVP250_57 [uncultured Caudovirales phage]|uniref:Uncharacterized protein n=1 Tax=uncultured Caudovirales phage TaxID=2100421 RepID=A0A6J5LIQ9_9CAUD|nr:hypothetical protein UFOVP250_57 [uncultured Caudovirales phage]
MEPIKPLVTPEPITQSNNTKNYMIYIQPEMSDWQCWCFGSQPGIGIVWTPLKGKEPNWFWRKMQYLCFGNNWVKK